jgi:hypothetical protein
MKRQNLIIDWNAAIRKNTHIKSIFAVCLCLSVIYILVITDILNSGLRIQFLANRQDDYNSADKLIEYYQIHERISKMNSSLRKIAFNELGLKGGGEGYGNMLYSFLSTFCIAILTQSQLVVRWPKIETYVDLPINIFMNINKSDGLNESEFKRSYRHIRPRESWYLKKNINSLMTTTLPDNLLRCMYDDLGAYFMEICANPLYFSQLAHYGIVNKETLNEAYQAISTKNISEDEKQKKLFQVGFEFGGFYIILLYLFFTF